MTTTCTTAPPVADLSWLIPLWESYGKQVEFYLVRGDFPTKFLEYISLLEKADPNIVEHWPDHTFGTTEKGEINAVKIRVKPFGLELLRKQPQHSRRQVTISGQEIDLRNRDNFLLMNADIGEVENVAASYLYQLRSKPIKAVRRACTCQLQRLMLLRGKEIRRDLYGSICLRLGYPLPPYFFRPDLPPSEWNKPDSPPLTGLRLLTLLRKLVPAEDKLTALLEKHSAYGNPENEVADLLALQKASLPTATLPLPKAAL